MSFLNFNLHPGVMAGVEAMGYTTPTPIQAQAIPPIMLGRDIIGLAQTGTGKTAAFLLPVLHRMQQLPRGRIGALVISPTRELAEQTCEVIDGLGQKMPIKSIAIYGGMGMDQQIRRLRRGVDIAVACPGRLLDHIWKGNIDLSHVDMLVIDEADRMFDMGFLPDIKNILKCIMQKHQTLIFSATMPQDISNLIKDTLHDPVTVQIGRSAPAATVSHALYPVKQHLKTPLLLEFLRRNKTESVLIFTRTKRRTDKVAMQLQKAGFKTVQIHGDMAQSRRQYSLNAFRSGNVKILVATDLAARGIDVQNISHVINYDMPESVDAYTHRIGRTGRLENKGAALTFITSEDNALVKDIEKVLRAVIERKTMEGFNYQAPAPLFNKEHEDRPFNRAPAPTIDREHARRPFKTNQPSGNRYRQPSRSSAG